MREMSEKPIFQGEWLSLFELTYRAPDGTPVVWEMVRRNKSRAGVVVVAKLVPSDRFILIKQFRPAINGYIISFPAGLADGDPAHALVELREETGYTGRIVEASPALKTGSSIIDDNGRIVCVEVPENDAVNRDPRQELEPSEEIEVILLPAERIPGFLKEEMDNGVSVSSNLWYCFGLGRFILAA